MNLICSGFGHRSLYYNINSDLINTITTLVEKEGVSLFFTGGMGDFDSAFSSAVRSVKQKHSDIKLILVKPYFSNELNTNKTFYETSYDDVIVPNELMGVHYKAAIQKRNRWMVDRSDFILSCIYRDFGGAYQTIRYAKRIGKTVIDLVKQ